MADEPDDEVLLARRAPVYELAFEEAGRALDAQERAVNELRSRAGVLMAAAAVAMSVFGTERGEGPLLQPATWVPLIAFAGVGVCVLACLWPRDDWQFSANPSSLIARYAEPVAKPVGHMHRELALHRAASYVVNGRRLRLSLWAFRLGVLMLLVETGSWLVALASGT